jgi:putative glutamine amidotransferase
VQSASTPEDAVSLPLIGLTGRRTTGRAQAGFHEILHHLDIDMYLADYSKAVIEAGGLPVHLPLDVDPATAADRLDAIVLTGGSDIEPQRYEAEPHPALIVPDRDRDEFELALLERALDRTIPVLGICRGIQLINVHRGGTLDQHVSEHSQWDTPTNALVHTVTMSEGSMLASLYGATREVNSLHHQCVDVVGDGLTVTACAADGRVEGLEMGDHVLAVQWHPEMMDSRSTDPIFDWLVAQAST